MSISFLKKHHRIFFSLFFTGILIFYFFTSCKKRNSSSPEKLVLFLLLDAARADHFSSLGYNRPTTPNIDRIAAKGVLFKNHYAQSWATVVSIPQIFSGRYFNKGMMEIADIPRRFADYPFLKEQNQRLIIPEYFNNSGFRTVLVSAHPWITEKSRLAEGFKELINVQPEKDSPYAKADRVINTVINIIRENRAKKLYIYVHLMDTHFPHSFSSGNRKFTEGKGKIADDAFMKNGFPLRMPTVYGEESFYLGNYPQKSLQYLKDVYDSDLYFTDRQIGNLDKFLTDKQLQAKTLWIITSDHGEALGENGMWGHAPFFFEGNQHIPLIISGYPLKKRSLKINKLTENVDIAPTLLDLLNIQFNKKDFDGKSLINLLNKKTDNKHRHNIVFFASTMAIGAKGRQSFLLKYLNLGIQISDQTGYCEKTDSLSVKELENLLSQKIYPKYTAFVSSSLEFPKNPFLVRFTEDITAEPLKTVESWNPYLKKQKFGPKYLEQGYEEDGKWFLNLFNISANGEKEETLPVNLHMRVPNTKYEIYLQTAIALLSSSKDKQPMFFIRAEKEKLWKTISIAKSKKMPPTLLNKFSSLQKDHAFFLSLGKYKIDDNSFDIEIAAKKRHWCIILGFLFVPYDYADNENFKETEKTSKKTDRIKKLKALGYLQ